MSSDITLCNINKEDKAMTDPTSHVRSIEILETIDIDDCRKVVVELAKQYPNILCELHDDPIVVSSTLEAIIVKLKEGKHKVLAVKIMRESTGWGLKQSKQYVDDLPIPYDPTDFSKEIAAQLRG